MTSDVKHTVEHYNNNLSLEDIKKLKKIGSGTDANIYKINNELLLKVYHKDSIHSKIDLESEVIKTDKPAYFKRKCEYQGYCYDEDGVRLSYNDIINFAKKKQQNISLSSLPYESFFINDHFKGCFLHYYKYHLPISSFQFLPEKTKLKLFKRILPKLDELLKNNIYTIDLYNKRNSHAPHNNIIVNSRLNPQIIDLEGRSVAYTAKFNQNYFEQTMFGLTTLLLEFIFNQYLDDYYDESYEYEDYYYHFFNTTHNIEPYYLDKIFNPKISIEDLDEFIDYRLALKK